MQPGNLRDAIIDAEGDDLPGVPAPDPEELTMAQLIMRANEAELAQQRSERQRFADAIPRAQTYGRGAVNSRAGAHKGEQAKRVAKARARRKAAKRR